MLISVLTCSLLAQAQPSPAGPGPAAVVSVRRSGVPPAKARALVKLLSQALAAQQVPLLPADELDRRLKQLGFSDSSFCNGKPECVRELGQQLAVPTLITLSLVLVKPDLSLSMQAISVASDARLAQESAVLPPDGKGAAEAMAAFAQAVASALAPPAPAAEPVASDAPVKGPALEPPPPPPRPVVAAPAPPRRSPGPAVVTLIGAVVAAGAAVGLGVDAALVGGALRGPDPPPGEPRTSPMTEVAAGRLATRANAELGAAIGSGVLAAALGVLTVALWPPPPP